MDQRLQYTPSVSTIKHSGPTYSTQNVRQIWESTLSKSDLEGKNTLGYLRTRTFYTPERKYAYKYASITKCFDMFTSRNVKKKSLNIHSHVQLFSSIFSIKSLFYTFTVRCIATTIFYYNHVRMLMFDGKL
jgi:hypothetical protein